MKGLQGPWKWIVILVSVLCLGSLLAIACAVVWVNYVDRTVTAAQGAEATSAALGTENVHLAAQLTRQVTLAATAAAVPTMLGVTPTSMPHSAGIAAATDIPRLTPTPASTSVPAGTPQPPPSPTNTVVPASSRQPTPAATFIPGEIRSFTASPDPVERGGAVTLTWNAPRTTSAGITRLSPEGDIFLQPEALDLPASGSIALQVPDEYTERVKYYLGARDANGTLHKAYVTAGIICRYDEYIAPRCPLTQDTIWAAYEPFERGHMVWRSDTREIYVLHAGGRYETYEDTWHEGDPVDISGTPAQGLQAPVRGFGNLYAHQPGVRQELGWATDKEAGYTMAVETIRGGSGRYPGTSTYFTLPDNRVVNLYPFTSTWQIVP